MGGGLTERPGVVGVRSLGRGRGRGRWRGRRRWWWWWWWGRPARGVGGVGVVDKGNISGTRRRGVGVVEEQDR